MKAESKWSAFEPSNENKYYIRNCAKTHTYFIVAKCMSTFVSVFRGNFKAAHPMMWTL